MNVCAYVVSSGCVSTINLVGVVTCSGCVCKVPYLVPSLVRLVRLGKDIEPNLTSYARDGFGDVPEECVSSQTSRATLVTVGGVPEICHTLLCMLEIGNGQSRKQSSTMMIKGWNGFDK
ncbi:hypothetical protein DERF_002679 [Dermatophagoides farinae]|uniref:Uncharacterized protein n=1 Tax=Dermatophagoides farinae TaxID=6954 RepID=A0A922IG15_DERFA|nr:hypothetical protein DERF_002679 [Dermatophagoides farinae]